MRDQAGMKRCLLIPVLTPSVGTDMPEQTDATKCIASDWHLQCLPLIQQYKICRKQGFR